MGGAIHLKHLVLCLAALSACQPFDYGPAVIPSGSGSPPLNSRSLAKIATGPDGPRGHGKFAVLADVHQSYDELGDAIAGINADTAIKFALLAGDVTQYGYAGEYRILSRLLSGLRVPTFIAIGNHDQQAEGISLFASYFGPTDFTFAWRGYLFVFFDDNGRITPGSLPRWDWLEKALAGAGDSLLPIPVCHAPPYTDQLDDAKSARLVALYARSHAAIVIGAHTHHYDFGAPYGDGIPYLVANDLGDREYEVVSLDSGKASVERVFF